MSELTQKAKEITTAAILGNTAEFNVCDEHDLNAALQKELIAIKSGHPKSMFAKLTILTVALDVLDTLIQSTTTFEETMEINSYQVMVLKELSLTADNLAIRLE